MNITAEYIISNVTKKSNKLACIKKPVYCMIEALNGKQFFGSNVMDVSPGNTCPRDDIGCLTGERYDLCISKCQQKRHAEIEAIQNALDDGCSIVGATLYLTGHYYCCDNCSNEIEKTKISEVIFLDV